MGLILCRIYSPFFAPAEKGAGGMSTCDSREGGRGDEYMQTAEKGAGGLSMVIKNKKTT